MIFTRVQVRNFRSLAHIDQTLGRFQALVGPNASGKTTFLDVFSLLKDLMAYGYDVQEAVAQRSVDFSKLLWLGQGYSFQIAVEAKIPDDVRMQLRPESQNFDHARYEMQIGLDQANNEIGIDWETFQIFIKPTDSFPFARTIPFDWQRDDGSIFWGELSTDETSNEETGGNHGRLYNYNKINNHQISRLRSSLPGAPKWITMPFASKVGWNLAALNWFADQLCKGVQNLVLDSQKIRQPSPPGRGNLFRPDGSNLPWVIEELRKDEKRFASWLTHVRTALEDIRDIRIIDRPEDRHRYLVIEYDNGAVVPSWLVSDGTLRLLALTILAYIKGLNDVFLIEEPENGIHPQAIETVIQSLQSIYDGQVLIATHSPFVIDQLNTDQIICFSKNAAGATETVSGDRHPMLQDWKRGRPNLSTLAASGILG